jgi:hypothetical protein
MRMRTWLPAMLLVVVFLTVAAGCGKGGGY